MFTLYLSPYAWINALGHVLKTCSYLLILNALFVSAIRRPYEELARARDELQSLYLDAREHRAEMERSFARIGSALSSSLELEEALDLIAELAEGMLHVDCAVVISVDRFGEAAGVSSQRGVCHKVDRPKEITRVLAQRVLAERATLVVDDVESTGLVNCDFQDPRCLRSAVCAPMIHEDLVLGVIAVYSYRKSAFEEGDVKLLEGFASHAAVAVHNAISYRRESRIADVLQRTFLSMSPMGADRFEIAQVYQPATDEALVGGDFYDVYETSDGKIALVIGDISGKGLTAAVHTAMVKFTLRAYLNEGHPPARALKLLNRAIERLIEPETFVTIFAGVLDSATGELTYANAGHEPPLYSCTDSDLTLPSTGLPLGVDPESDYEEGRIVLEPGCVLLL
ncbi:MAG: SpoIIE family protein phosphatase, partial [Armatimonadota bacterium]